MRIHCGSAHAKKKVQRWHRVQLQDERTHMFETGMTTHTTIKNIIVRTIGHSPKIPFSYCVFEPELLGVDFPIKRNVLVHNGQLRRARDAATARGLSL